MEKFNSTVKLFSTLIALETLKSFPTPKEKDQEAILTILNNPTIGDFIIFHSSDLFYIRFTTISLDHTKLQVPKEDIDIVWKNRHFFVIVEMLTQIGLNLIKPTTIKQTEIKLFQLITAMSKTYEIPLQTKENIITDINVIIKLGNEDVQTI